MKKINKKFKVLILGVDGYIGWSLAMHLSLRGHKVSGIDNFSRRKNVKSIGSFSAIPILDMEKRLEKFYEIFKKRVSFHKGDITNYDFLSKVIRKIKPDVIVHLAEQPSAPFSMIDRKHAVYTQHNNVEGTLNVLYAMKQFVPKSHLVKLGTLGEYGQPNVIIPEGFFKIQYKGRIDFLPFPRQPGSFYHLSKVHDSANILFACKIWGLKSTDVMQGVVYGTRTPEIVDGAIATRFDFDESFGTVINRYCAQAVIGFPLTPYGLGKQKRGFIALVDCIQCITIAIENPPNIGEYRVFNQFDEVYDLTNLANYVVLAGKKAGLDVRIKNIKNPRIEKEKHFYKVEHNHLKNLGFKPTEKIEKTLDMMIQDLLRYKDRIKKKKNVIMPKTTWK